ncbi:hypothetical protein CANMA_004814 [Candida margitis]|uniref:uncharacterized protein n=1 Tax=Candida margitis TaxID=1775924 RepID=UPI0022268FE5|nr:uncharacterized protein CANMA_004814 [Candida margitis]KAI5953975.1 hypothetical protein CANMA_004814 [Candida margitis]
MIKLFSRRLIVKLLLLLTVAYTIIASFNQIIAKSSLQEYRKLLTKQFTHKFNQLYYNFLASDFDLNNDDKFNEELHTIRQMAVEEDDDINEIWMLNEKLTENLPLTVPIPSNFGQSDDSSQSQLLSSKTAPLVHKFDPRFTFGAYYQYIARTPPSIDSDLAVPFHWSDWVDLSILDKYITSFPKTDLCSTIFDVSVNEDLIKGSTVRKVEEYCQVIQVEETESQIYPQLGFKITDQPGQQTLPNRELIGRAYLFDTAPSPKKLIFLTTNGSHHVDVLNPQKNNFNNSLLRNGMIDSLPIDTFNVVEDYKYLQSQRPETIQQQQHGAKGGKSLHELAIPESNFHNDPESTIKSMLDKQEKTQLTLMEQDYLNSITFSHNCKDPPKYFYEAKLLKSTPHHWEGEHYDWRFFHGVILDSPENPIILHRLIKNYLNFARIHGITTWIAHGSLLSWYWNGVAFPWDTDIDVQVPVADLYKLGRLYNQTLVVENVVDAQGNFDGFGRYFIDIGSTITHRTRGNGNNAIDGRFIDVDTGLYIDITGLALTDAPSPSRYSLIVPFLDKDKQVAIKNAESLQEDGTVQQNYSIINKELQLYNCRNQHFTSYQELSPLITSTCENQIAYIPKNFMSILNDEYNINSLSNKQYRKFTYLNNLRLWFPTIFIKQYLGIKDIWLEEYDFKLMTKLNSLTEADHLKMLAGNRALLQEWELTKNFTLLHQQELQLIFDGKFDKAGDLINDNLVGGNGVGKALRADYFMHKLMSSEAGR